MPAAAAARICSGKRSRGLAEGFAGRANEIWGQALNPAASAGGGVDNPASSAPQLPGVSTRPLSTHKPFLGVGRAADEGCGNALGAAGGDLNLRSL